MAEPVLHEGVWWHQKPDGSWLRWDPDATTWVEHAPVHSEPVASAEIEPFQPLRRLRDWLLALFVLSFIVDAVALWSNLLERELVTRIGTGRVVPGAVVGNDMRQYWVNLVQVTVFLPVLMVFLMWFQRAYRNLPALGARDLRFTPGWAIGAWFVPILNWFRPGQIAADIWRASDPQLPRIEGTPWAKRSMTPLIPLWMLTWWFSSTTDQGQIKMGVFVSFWDRPTANTLDIASTATRLVATVLVVVFLVRVTRRQERRTQGAEPTEGATDGRA